MIWERPWALTLLVLFPAIAWLALRARAPLTGRGQRALLAALQCTAWAAIVVALAGPWSAADHEPPTRVAIALPGADPGAIAAWRSNTPHGEPFLVIRGGARPKAGRFGVADIPDGPSDAPSDAPDVAGAIRLGLTHVPPEAPGEIAVLGTAGDAGGPLAPLAEAARAGGVRIHARTSPPRDLGPILIGVRHPARVDVREPFRAEIDIRAADSGAARIVVRTGGTELARIPIEVRPTAVATYLIDVPPMPATGVATLEFALVVDGATDPERHVERTAILAEGSPRVLWLGASDQAGRALADTLAPHGIGIVTGDPTAPFASAPPADFDVVVVDDLPAGAWPEDAQRDLAETVAADGTGLLIAGAFRSLGPGGYADSPLAALLPVDLPQREERRDPSVALVLVIDTSGSMGNRVELAKEVARLSLRRLLPHDKAGIVEFYGSKRWAAPLQPASNTIELMRALNRMQAGGGTIIYSALEEGFYALLNARTRFKHILVLTDGGVESGPFEALARRMASSGINLSTVLIGPQSNSPFLMNLAQWGRGRFYAAPSRFQLPDLRFKEPQTTLMPAVQQKPFAIEASESESARALANGGQTIGGLVEARLRRGAEALVSVSGGGQPILAGWDQGAGRVVVMATELLGPMADPVREHGWAALVADQIRTLARGRQATRPRLEVDARPDALRATLVDPARAVWPNPILVLEADGLAPVRISMTPASEGQFAAELPWPSGAPIRLAVEGTEVAAAAVNPLPRDRRLGDVSTELARLAGATGGSLEGPLPIEPGPSPAGTPRRPLAPALILAAIAAFLLSLLVRRWPSSARIGAVGALIAVALAPAAGAQDPIRDRIDAELREVGSLERLAEEWRDGTPAEQLALAREQGDLDRILALTEDAEAGQRTLRILALEAVGRLDEALALVRALRADPDTAEVERAVWQLREAELLAASDAEDADQLAAQAFRDAAEALGDAAASHAIGHLAAGYGLLEVGLELHVPPDGASAGARTATHLRRALWSERLDDVDGALAEYRAAREAATLRRERRFALSREIALTKDAGRLQEVAEGWIARLHELDTDEKAALLDALRELEQGERALEILAREELRGQPELQDEALAIAVETGDTGAAVERAQARLAADPDQPRLRISLALLLTDLRRIEEARSVLVEGMRTASRRELLMLVEAASELTAEAAFQSGLDLLRARGEERDDLDAVLLEHQHLRRKQRNELAIQLVLDARTGFQKPTSKVRLGEALESAGRASAAIDLYREAQQATKTEDLALRLAWLLSNSGDEAEREESAALFREIWLNAGSQARRVQAEERVLDLAAREGTLADLAIELEEALEDPSTEHLEQKREALVKIWARAQDTFGAREVLMQWARDEPEHEVDAWQRLAQVYLENEEFKNHEKALRHLIDIDPEAELDYRQQLALGFLERGRPVEARQVIREMMQDGADPDAVAFEFSAGIFSLAGRHREAAALYRRALALHPDRIETLLLWANAMAAQDRAPEAVGRFVDILMQEVPDDLFLVAVDGLLNLEAPREALRFAERALRRLVAEKPDKVFLQRALQDVLEQLGDEPARLMSLEETLLVAGLQRTAWLRELMDESARRRDWKTYLRDAQALLRTGDEVPPAVFLEIGEVLLKSDEMRAAERAFARARLATDFAKVENRVAELYERAGRIEDAERVRRRVLRRDPDDPSALVAVARLVERRGDLADALHLYRDAAELLFEGQDLGAERRTAPGLSRNRTETGPSYAQALEGVLRCAGSAADTAPLSTRIEERLTGGGSLEPKARLALIGHLRRLATAWADDDAIARTRELEDAVLAGEGVDDETRVAVSLERLGRGDVDGATAALLGMADDVTQPARLKLALVRGDVTAALALLDDESLRDWGDVARTFLVRGADDAVAEVHSRLAAHAAEGIDGADYQLERLDRLLGNPVDPRPRMDANLRKALEAEGELRSRVGRLVSALRGHAFLTDEERAAHLRPGIAETVRAKDRNVAWTILSAARTWMPAEELAPLVPLQFEDGQQIYMIASRASFLDLLAPDEAARVLRSALSKFPDAEVRSLVLRMISTDELPAALQETMLSGLRLTDLQPSDRTWLTRICCDTEFTEKTAAIVGRALRRDLPDDPRAAILEARFAPDANSRRAALREAAAALSKVAQPDYAATQSIERVGTLADATLRTELLARPLADDAPTGALLLYAELYRTDDKPEQAADLLLAAIRRQPENTMLLHEAQPLLQSLGRIDDAIALYEAYVEQAAPVYPHQAGQLARLYLEGGRPADALAALRRADDSGGSNLGLMLRAAAQLDDAERRAQSLRGWVQQVQQVGRRRGGSFVMMIGGGERGHRHTPADVLAALRVPTVVPSNIDEARQDGDVLAFMPEGRAAAEALLRGMDDTARQRSAAVYRGMLGSAARAGTVEPILARMRSQLEARPFDAEALRFALAAAQVGLPVDAGLLERAIVRRASSPPFDAEVWIDLLWTAHTAGLDALVDRLLPGLLENRSRLSSYQLRDRIGDVFRLAADRRPEMLRQLGPDRSSPNVYYDGDLLAVLVLADPDAAAVRDAFPGIPAYLDRQRPNHWSARLALPWAGLCARLGDVEGAIDALLVDDPQVENGDTFPARCLAAAAPPLDTWNDPELASSFGARLAEEAARTTRTGKRGTLLRVGLLLAHRMDQADRGTEAAALRAQLAPHVATLPFVKPWLEELVR